MRGRVQGFEVLLGDVCQLGCYADIHVAWQGHALKIRVIGNAGQHHAVLRRITHNIFHCLQLGHIHACFHRHVQVGVSGGEACALVTGNGFTDIAFAPVVSGQGQVPITEHFVQTLQVVERRSRGCLDIASVVAKSVLLEVEAFTRGRHELPHATGARTGNGLWVEGTLDEGQQSQFSWHFACFELFNNMKQVFAGAFAHPLQIVGFAGVPLCAVVDQIGFQIGHLIALADALPQVVGQIQLGHTITFDGAFGNRAQATAALGGC